MEHKLLNNRTKAVFFGGVLVYIIFYIFTIIVNIYFSVTDYGYITKFSGLENYIDLFSDPNFFIALKNKQY